MSDDTILSPLEAAKILGVSRQTVNRWCEQKIIPHIIYPHNRVKILLSSIVEWQTLREVLPANMEAEKAIRKSVAAKNEYDAINREALKRLAKDHGIKINK